MMGHIYNMLMTLTAHSMAREARLTDDSSQGHQGADGGRKRTRIDGGDEEGRPRARPRIGDGGSDDIASSKATLRALEVVFQNEIQYNITINSYANPLPEDIKYCNYLHMMSLLSRVTLFCFCVVALHRLLF